MVRVLKVVVRPKDEVLKAVIHQEAEGKVLVVVINIRVVVVIHVGCSFG